MILFKLSGRFISSPTSPSDLKSLFRFASPRLVLSISPNLPFHLRLDSMAMEPSCSAADSSMEASSAAASPSSSSTNPSPFPWDLEGFPVRFICRRLSCTAHVQSVVRREQNSTSTVHIRLSGAPRRLPFSGGEPAYLIAGDGKQWAGHLGLTDPDKLHSEGAFESCSDLYHSILFVRVPHTGHDEVSFIEFATSVSVHLTPVLTSFRPSAQNNPWSRRDPNIKSGIPIKIGVNGFGKIGRLVSEVALQSIDVQLVAINDHSIENSSMMVNAWNNKNIGVTLKDYKTLLFWKLYDKQSIPIPSELFDYKEVAVLNFSDEADIPWDRAGAEFVVHSAGFYKENASVQKVNDEVHNPGAAIAPNSLDSCLRHLPKAIAAFGLNLDQPMIRSNFNDANEVDSIRTACLSIITGSKRAAEGMRKIFPEWDGTPNSTLFHAEVAAADMLAVDLTVSLANKDIQLENDDARNDPEPAERLVAILSFCVDLIRYVPIGGCLLELF